MKKIFLLFTIFSLVLTSCKKEVVDKCEDVICYNGAVCEDGTCLCPEGYEGTNCQETESTKFLGEWEIICNGSLDIKGDNVDFVNEPGIAKIYQGEKTDEIILYVQLDMVTESVPMTVEAFGEVDGLDYEMDREAQKIFYEIDGLGAIEFNYKIEGKGELNKDMDELESEITFTGDISGTITCLGEK